MSGTGSRALGNCVLLLDLLRWKGSGPSSDIGWSYIGQLFYFFFLSIVASGRTSHSHTFSVFERGVFYVWARLKICAEPTGLVPHERQATLGVVLFLESDHQRWPGHSVRGWAGWYHLIPNFFRRTFLLKLSNTFGSFIRHLNLLSRERNPWPEKRMVGYTRNYHNF